MTKEEKLQFKFKYDKMLDDVFFTKEFKQYMMENCKFCPSGLTPTLMTISHNSACAQKNTVMNTQANVCQVIFTI